jgi:hypothetical protein
MMLVDRNDDDGQTHLPSRDIVPDEIVWEPGHIQGYEASNNGKQRQHDDVVVTAASPQ